MYTKFLVFTDLHADIVHDAVARMQAICAEAKAQDVDFILHLGDIMYPETDFLLKHAPESIEKRRDAWFLCDRDDEKLAIKALLAETGLPVHSVLGNHDMDSCSKETACLYWNIPHRYYSCTEGGVRFIALDTNHFTLNGEYIHYDHNNYRISDGDHTSWLGPEQLAWLEAEIMVSAEPCVLLSHAPLSGCGGSVHDNEEVLHMLHRVNSDRRRVILALNGHNHEDGMTVRAGIPFVQVNSASNLWLGEAFAAVRYSETISRLYPHIVHCAPYLGPLYSVVTISDEGIDMTGMETIFVGTHPRDMFRAKGIDTENPTAAITARRLPLTEMDDT